MLSLTKHYRSIIRVAVVRFWPLLRVSSGTQYLSQPLEMPLCLILLPSLSLDFLLNSSAISMDPYDYFSKYGCGRKFIDIQWLHAVTSHVFVVSIALGVIQFFLKYCG